MNRSAAQANHSCNLSTNVKRCALCGNTYGGGDWAPMKNINQTNLSQNLYHTHHPHIQF